MFASKELTEQMARIVERSPDYRVLRRLPPFEPRDIPNADLTLIVLDTETSGLDTSKDEIIELSMIRASCTMDGQIARVDATFSETQEPQKPIPASIIKLTGISNEAVAGTFIDPDFVAEFIRDADLIVAHNAEFDRKFAERLVPEFADKPWGCSCHQIPWPDTAKRLEALLAARGLFHNTHRGFSDCEAVLHLLSCELDGRSALSHLFENAHQATTRIFADGAPYAAREILKERGYRWDPGRRAWFRDVSLEEVSAETAFLGDAIFNPGWQPVTVLLDAFNRFSERL